MPEIRQNLITRQWVIIAPERGQRPNEFKLEKKSRELPAHDPECPFCPGNENQTPPEIYRHPQDGDWQVRVIPNKYSALESEGVVTRTTQGVKRTISGVGLHEIIVESATHNQTMGFLSNQEMQDVVEAYLRRYNEAAADQRVEAVTLFKNYGPTAGTSLAHPHSQIIGTPMIPPDVRERLESALRYYDDSGMCIFCATLQTEMKDEARIVAENKDFVAFIPFAALSPFHIWIFPRRHCASFSCLEEEEVPSFAEIVRVVLRKIYDGLGDPDFNLVIRTAPKESESVRYYHWYVSVVPRVERTAGFEMGSGMFINSSLPEVSALFLREIPAD